MVPEIAEQYQLHELGRRILSEIESQTESCIPPPRPVKKRKRPENRTTTASASVSSQTADAPSSNRSRTSKRVRLNQSSASSGQGSTPMTHSRHDQRSVLFGGENSGNEHVLEVSVQHPLSDLSSEAPSFQRSESGSQDNGPRCSNSQNTPYWPIHQNHFEAQAHGHIGSLSQSNVLNGDTNKGAATGFERAQPSVGGTIQTPSTYLHHNSLTTRADRAVVAQSSQPISLEDTAASGSIARSDDVSSSNRSRMPSNRARLDQNLTSHKQTPTPMANSRHIRNEPYEKEDGGTQHEASSHPTLADSSLEVPGYQSPSHDSGLRRWNSQKMPYWNRDRRALDSEMDSPESLSNQSERSDTTTEEVIESETPVADANGRQHVSPHQDRGSSSNEFSVEPVLNPLPSLQGQSITNDIEWGDYFLPVLFSEYLPNPLPPSTATSAPAGWDLVPSSMMNRPSDSEYLPNPLPPSTATSTPAGWDMHQSNTISQPTYEYLANPLPPFTATSAAAGWDLHQSSTISQPTHCEYLPNPLPPSTAASALAEWDSHQSVPSDTSGKSTRSPSIRSPNLPLLSEPIIDRLTWSGIPYSSSRTPAPVAIF